MPDIFDASKKTPEASPSAPAETHQAEVPPVENHTEENLGTTDTTAEKPNPRKGRNVDDYSSVMREEKASNNALRSYVPKPTKIHFDSQQADEQVLLLLRRHPVTQIGWIIIAIILIFLPMVFDSIGLLNAFPLRFQFAAMIGWYLLVLGFILESFLSWFYNVFLITDERVIDVDFHNLLYKNISAAKIDNIEDVTSEAGGILASVFNYGTVKVQTAGTATEFEFEDVPQPAKVTAFLNEMLLEEEREQHEGRAT